jgi:hypothetical protein
MAKDMLKKNLCIQIVPGFSLNYFLVAHCQAMQDDNVDSVSIENFCSQAHGNKVLKTLDTHSRLVILIFLFLTFNKAFPLSLLSSTYP